MLFVVSCFINQHIALLTVNKVIVFLDSSLEALSELLREAIKVCCEGEDGVLIFPIGSHEIFSSPYFGNRLAEGLSDEGQCFIRRHKSIFIVEGAKASQLNS